MATLRTRIKGEPITVELTIVELHQLLEKQRFEQVRRIEGRSARRDSRLSSNKEPELATMVSEHFATAIRRTWPERIALVDEPDLTTGNVRRFLIQRVLDGNLRVSTDEVTNRFFGRSLSPMNPNDLANLRRLWYCVREAKRDIEQVVGGRWEDDTDAPLRQGTSRSWKLVPTEAQVGSENIMAYRETP
ncbi:MAG: hypothetical protein M1144_01920 [Candidatus Thermoplasmatota archaeon]|nr:hypothetical protein [Candidatus Thermoplasmatota archaeon]MCL5984041.1 hypothetical protein [Candidatus Thermoplasmatota archaeon]